MGEHRRGEVSKYGAPAKLTINDVLKAELHANEADTYSFRDMPFRIVDIMGVVTGRKCIDSRVVYTVDDGTGVINCLYDHERSAIIQERDEALQVKKEINESNQRHPPELLQAMQQLIAGVINKTVCQLQILDHGDCARVLGFICEFHGSREIKAFQLYKVSSILEEQDRIAEIGTLYKKVYGKQA